jgi:hypothetical protein
MDRIRKDPRVLLYATAIPHRLGSMIRVDYCVRRVRCALRFARGGESPPFAKAANSHPSEPYPACLTPSKSTGEVGETWGNG